MEFSMLEKAWMRDIKAIVPLKIGLGECFDHNGSSEKASRSIIHCVQSSVTASSNCGWNMLMRKSSRKDVSVLIGISELMGTMSFRCCKKASDGGRRIVMLKTLGSMSSLCPAAEISDADRSAELITPVFVRDLETRPGTEVFRISSSSSCSLFM